MYEETEEKKPQENILKQDAVNLAIYFVPPLTTNYMKWGECSLVIIFLGIMFSIITIIYVNINMNEYQSRIDVMMSGKLYGIDPQAKFEKYIRDTQSESIATAMGTIDKSTDVLNRAINRMDDKSTRLTRQLANDTKTTSTTVDNLGKSIQENVGNLGGFMEKLGGALALNSYMTNGGAITNTKLPPGSNSPALFSNNPGSAGPAGQVLDSGPAGQVVNAVPAGQVVNAVPAGQVVNAVPA